ncbi:hypothetical protein L6452_13632 [Arctium lappa]|uniref:Uncharacterized protein n=1 Tax=Arctium lappa TaxID=4217 RepID=A0ACB9CIQ4_ARCLA|nr:hypothetical protein L6452_13632 [Arctium lappa]
MLSLFSDRQVELELSDEIALVEKCAPFTLPLPLVELVALLPLSEWSDVVLLRVKVERLGACRRGELRKVLCFPGSIGYLSLQGEERNTNKLCRRERNCACGRLLARILTESEGLCLTLNRWLLLVPHPQLGVACLTDQIDGKTIFKSRFPLFLVYPAGQKEKRLLAKGSLSRPGDMRLRRKSLLPKSAEEPSDVPALLIECQHVAVLSLARLTKKIERAFLAWAVLSSIPRSASHCWRAIHAQLDFVDNPPRPHISVKEAFNDPNLMDEILSILDPISIQEIQSMRGCLSEVYEGKLHWLLHPDGCLLCF